MKAVKAEKMKAEKERVAKENAEKEKEKKKRDSQQDTIPTDDQDEIHSKKPKIVNVKTQVDSDKKRKLNQIDDLKSDDDEPVQKKTKFTKTDQMDLTDSDTEEFLSPPTFSIKNFSPTIPVGQLSKFSMQASNASPSSLVIGVTLKGPIQLDGYVVKENDLLYRISVFPTRVGDYSLVINVDNKPIPNVPSQIKVTKDITTTTTTTTTANDNDDETASLVFGDTLLEKHKGKATVPQGKIEKNSDLGKKSKKRKNSARYGHQYQ